MSGEPLVWAACNACQETWTVQVHPDWLPPEEATREAGLHVQWHHTCPVRRGVTVGIEP